MLELKNVSFTVDGENGKKQILNNVSLTMEKKKIYVITGPNGGGKSSLAKVIMGIYPATGGTVLMDGEDITDKNITERARMGIGYAFQRPPRFKGIKVSDMLQLSSGSDCVPDLCDLLFDVGLCSQDYLDREINDSFSGGEMKRVEIASLLGRDLKVAIFDEPEAGIDLWSFQRLATTFQEMNEQTDTTIVIISHQKGIMELADQVILVAGGEITEMSSPDKFLAEIEEEEAFCRCKGECTKVGGKASAQLVG